ncbi:MAG: Holliday junction resolvase RuvX [Clostridiales bacterium]|nr:Holliday junction resolvase RuvX [Clostridiales bacterium]
MIIIGIDYGDVRTGISVCDKFETLASPVKVIFQRNQEKLIDEIISIANEYNAELIVVGLPKNMDGTTGFSGKKCLEFADKIKEKSKISVTTHDERLTTVSAYNLLSESNVYGKKRRAVVDEVASTIILQDFIDRRKKQGSSNG